MHSEVEMLTDDRSNRLLPSSRTVPFLALLLLTSLGSWACGPSNANPCQDKTCERGICHPGTGQCVNPSSCGGAAPAADAGQPDGSPGSGSSSSTVTCLKGFSCVEGTCLAKQSCQTNADCRSGICKAGACVNPDSCESDDECVRGDTCGSKGKCVEDKCAQTSCDRGVCEPETGECINRNSCPSPSGEKPACLKDYSCYNGKCLTGDELCDQLDCDRGVCNPDEQKCTDAETCEEAADCLAGKYCDDGTCKENACDPASGECDRGVCSPQNGCVNPESCSASSDCLPAHYCVENKCVPTDEACGTDGCPGNQICEYDESSLTATCKENPNEPCENGLDCTDERICAAGRCIEPRACAKDDHEPNNYPSDATKFFESAEDGRLRGSVCSGDTDLFLFDTDEADHKTGKLVVHLDYHSQDLGLGSLEMKVVDPSGNEIASKKTDAKTGKPGEIHIESMIGSMGQTGVYGIKISDSGDVSKAGVRYEFYADVVHTEVTNECGNAKSITPSASPIHGNTNKANTIKFDATCAPRGANASDNLYSFTLQKKSYVTIDVEPTKSSADVTVSLRRSCEFIQSEAACADAKEWGKKETIERALEAGTYYLIVQPPAPGAGGPYRIDFSSNPFECTASDNQCINNKKAKVCTEKGKLKEVTCQNGCDSNTGQCQRPQADVCRTAVDASNGIKDFLIDWSTLDDTFNPGPKSCLQDKDPQSDGNDAVFRVEIPPKGALWAHLEHNKPTQATGSLYILDSCRSRPRHCFKGADSDSSDETLAYENPHNRPKVVYVVADSKANTGATANLDIQVGRDVCRPGNTQCQSGDLYQCNSVGVGWKPYLTCTGGCTMGQCHGQICTAAIDATGGGTWTVDTSKFQNTYHLWENDCTGSKLDGPDTTFKIPVKGGDIVEATVKPKNSNDDPAIYITGSCGSTVAQAKSCVGGADGGGSGAKESVYYRVPPNSGGTYYVVVDSKSSGGAMGKWDVGIQTRTPSCTPGTKSCQGANTIKYCSKKGRQHKTYTCKGSNPTCTTKNGTAVCNDPSGGACADPIPVSDGDSVEGTFAGKNAITFKHGWNGKGGCFIQKNYPTKGYETYYSIELDKGDLLTASLDTTNTQGRIYFLDDCQRADSCLAINQEADEAVQYHAESKKTVYIVVDATSTYRPKRSYTLDIDVEKGMSCVPNDTYCLTDTKAAVCNSQGTGALDSFQCTNGCSKGACRTDISKYDTCGSAFDAGDGISVWGSYADLNREIQLSRNSCASDRTEGPDAFYKVALQKGDVLKAKAKSLSFGRTILYATKSCSMPEKQCVAGDFADVPEAGTEIKYTAKKAETIYVGIDTGAKLADGFFELHIAVAHQQCTPGKTACVGTSTKELKYCNNHKLWNYYTCGGACKNGKCTKPTGDVCYDPVPLAKNETVSSTFSGSDHITLAKERSGACLLDQSQKTTGRDDIYSVSLDKGDLLEAKLTTSESSGMLMILENCVDTETCVTNTPFGDNSKRQYYYADQKTTVYLVVDASNVRASQTYTLQVETHTNRKCAPGRTQCTSSNEVGVCNGAGTAYLEKYQCANGCKNGYCTPGMAVDKCSTAPLVTDGFVAYHDLGELHNKVQVTSASGCVSKPGYGPEAIYRLKVLKGETYHIQSIVHDNGIPITYIVGDCTRPNQTCLAGEAETYEGTTDIYYEAKKNRTVYVVFDDRASRSSSSLEIRIDKVKAECKTGNATCGSASGIINYCGPHEQKRAHWCNDACKKGTCTHPTGNRCIEAIPMSDGDTYRGRLTRFTNTLEPPAGSCGIKQPENTPGGPDAIFSVNLNAGETLDAKVDTQLNSLGMYLLDKCPASSFNRCKVGDPKTSQLTYLARTTGTYYLVLDTVNPNPIPPFELDVSIDSGGQCTPGAARCNPSGNLDVCNADGTAVAETYNCQNGCSDRSCQAPQSANDTCLSAHNVGNGVRFVDDWSRFHDDVDPAKQSNSCVTDADGSDAVYEVHLDKDELVTVEAEAHADGESPVVYVTQGCSVTSTCESGDQAVGQRTASTAYYNDTGSTQTVYAVVDNDSYSYSGKFTVDIDVDQRDCKPNPSNPPQTCLNSKTSRTCTNSGVYETKHCYFGCDSSTGACKPVPNNKCGGAIEIKSPGTFKGSLKDYAPNYESATGPLGRGCTGGRTAGRDATYKVKLDKGDIIDLTYDAPGNAAIWITTDCSNAAKKCVYGTNNFDPEHFTFQAPQKDTYYLIADVSARSAYPLTDEFVLDVHHVGAPVCTPGQVTCSSSQTALKYCVGPGMERTYKCDGGCSGSSCTNPRGGICADAIPLSAGTSVTGDFDTVDGVNPGYQKAGACEFRGAGKTPIGSDRIYSVTLNKGDTLTAEYVSDSRVAMMYLLEKCDSPKTCRAFTGRGATGALQYTADANKTVYLVVDRSIRESSNAAKFTLEIGVN